MGGNAGKIERNKQILEYVKAYNKLPENQRTRANALKIFNMFNTNNAGASQAKLDNVDDIDDFFKNIMGITVMSQAISKDEFLENIDEWAIEFAKYKAPAPKKETPAAKPIPKIDSSTVLILSDALSSAITPEYGNNWWGDMFSDDDTMAANVKALFVNSGDGSPYINAQNIVEVLDQLDLKAFRKSCNLLDDKDETAVLKLVTTLVRERINNLKKAKITIPADVETSLNKISSSAGGYWSNGGNEQSFDNNMTVVINGLRGLGVTDD